MAGTRGVPEPAELCGILGTSAAGSYQQLFSLCQVSIRSLLFHRENHLQYMQYTSQEMVYTPSAAGIGRLHPPSQPWSSQGTSLPWYTAILKHEDVWTRVSFASECLQNLDM